MLFQKSNTALHGQADYVRDQKNEKKHDYSFQEQFEHKPVRFFREFLEIFPGRRGACIDTCVVKRFKPTLDTKKVGVVFGSAYRAKRHFNLLNGMSRFSDKPVDESIRFHILYAVDLSIKQKSWPEGPGF